jgi:hypothetical protein
VGPIGGAAARPRGFGRAVAPESARAGGEEVKPESTPLSSIYLRPSRMALLPPPPSIASGSDADAGAGCGRSADSGCCDAAAAQHPLRGV